MPTTAKTKTGFKMRRPFYLYFVYFHGYTLAQKSLDK